MSPTPRLCRAAAHSIVPRTPHALWITDDGLVDALHRYTKASDLAKRSGSKRFGSNVPGPLEARRRLAGRRMGALSAVGPPSAAVDFGALFGGPFAGANRTSVEKSWSWEPPRPASQSVTPDEDSMPAPTLEIPDPDLIDYDPWERFRERLQPIKKPRIAINLMQEFRVEPEDRILMNQIACDHFIARITSDRRDGHKWLFRFVLENKYSAKKAGLVKRVAQHVAETGFVVARKLDDFVSNFLPTACRHGKLSESDLSLILDMLPSICYRSATCDVMQTKERLFRAYWNIWRALLESRKLLPQRLGRETVVKLAKYVASLPDPPPKRSRGHNTDWPLFRLELYNLAWPTNELRSDARNFPLSIESWARRLMEPESPTSTSLCGLNWGVLVGLMNSLPRIKAQFVMITVTRRLFDDQVDFESDKSLQTWVNCLARVRHCSLPDLPSYRLGVFEVVPLLAARVELLTAAKHFDNMDPVNLARGWLRAWLPFYVDEPSDIIRWEYQHARLKVAFEEGAGPGRMDPRLGYDDTRMFELIFRLFADFGITCVEVQRALQLLLDRHGPGEIFRLLQRLRSRNIYLHNPSFLASLIDSVAQTRPLRALELFKKTPGLWLSLCPNMALTLIAEGALKREEFFALANRWPKVTKKGLSEDEIATKKEELCALRSEMVHFAALTWADAGILPTRVRFRNVYWCWRYLLDNQLPLTPLLSKAFVRAAITAPLQNHQWVSRRKIVWVLEKFVLPLEGEFVKQELSRLIHFWRGELIQEARRRWDMAGYFARFGPSTVEKVRLAGLFEHDFPRRTMPDWTDDNGMLQRMLVRRLSVRSGPNAAERFPRLWSDRTYGSLPERDRLRWFHTPVLGNKRARKPGPVGNPRTIKNVPWKYSFKKDMARWKKRKAERRESRATKQKIRELLKTPESLAADQLEALKQAKKHLDMKRKEKAEWCQRMSKFTVWTRAQMMRRDRKWTVLPVAAKPHRSCVLRKVEVDGEYKIPQALCKSRGYKTS